MSPHSRKHVNQRSFAVLGVLSVAAVAGCALISDGGGTPTATQAPATEVAALAPLSAADIHAGLDYPLDRVAESKQAPRIILTSIDADLDRIPDVAEKKATFFRIMLPIIAQENDRIRADRQTILRDPAHVPADLFEKYGVAEGDVRALLARADVVPASLVLAQAALESGWGTSRFAREGNNFFGLRTYDPGTPGIAPKDAEGFKVRAFDSIAQSVHVYLRNINTHDAYMDLRRARSDLRTAGKEPDGATLSHHLASYSEIPEAYGERLRTLMAANGLDRFDGTELASS